MNKKPFLSVALLALSCLSVACGSGKKEGGAEAMPVDTITTFTLPAIPPMLDAPELRADYLVRNYWQNINWADTNYVHHPDVTEQAWVNFLDLLPLVPAATADAALKELFASAEAEKTCLLYLAELADKYLYDPNSPMRNEEYYISVLDALLASSQLSDVEKSRPDARRRLAQQNRLGTQALDFAYTTASGQHGTLHGLRTPYVLLFFNNPGCHACEVTIAGLKEVSLIADLIAARRLTLLSIYPDEEVDEWRKHLSEFPVSWINAYDTKQALRNNNLYDLKAIPTLYLLDGQKTVLLKDATVEQVEQYLLENTQQ